MYNDVVVSSQEAVLLFLWCLLLHAFIIQTYISSFAIGTLFVPLPIKVCFDKPQFEFIGAS
jgi:hypothetical protein